MATAKTAKTTALILVVLVHNWTFAQLKVDLEQWKQWTRSLLPKKEDREVKEELLKRLHLASEKGEEEILTHCNKRLQGVFVFVLFFEPILRIIFNRDTFMN